MKMTAAQITCALRALDDQGKLAYLYEWEMPSGAKRWTVQVQTTTSYHGVPDGHQPEPEIVVHHNAILKLTTSTAPAFVVGMTANDTQEKE